MSAPILAPDAATPASAGNARFDIRANRAHSRAHIRACLTGETVSPRELLESGAGTLWERVAEGRTR